jgi:transketolase
MALAPVVYTLWQQFLRFDPADPIWPNRDRFVLSIGHASMLLYALLHLTGVKAVNPKYEARVISVPSWELFEQQDQAYRDSVIPPDVTARVSVEQGSTFGWARFTGLDGARLGMKTFGASAPLQELQRKFGFTVESVVAAAKAQVRSRPERRV